MGHNNVALLNGGLPAWTRKKLPMTSAVAKPLPKQFVVTLKSGMVIDTQTMESVVEGNSQIIIDARAEERFNGDVEPLDKVAGHIPGALNSPFDDNLDIDGTFMQKDEMAELYANFIGGKSASQVVMMCGSGVTACHNILAMEIAGLPGARLYAGSWSEWITDSGRAVAIGK